MVNEIYRCYLHLSRDFRSRNGKWQRKKKKSSVSNCFLTRNVHKVKPSVMQEKSCLNYGL